MRSLALALFALGTAAAATTPPGVTFTKDVLPVLQKNCQSCHRPGEAAPMSFLDLPAHPALGQSHQNGRAQQADAALVRRPPLRQVFERSPTLSQAEIDTLVAWADTGAKEGNPKDAPAPASFTEGWQIGKPDDVIEMPQEFAVPASGTIDYQYIVIPTGFTEDKYVQMAEARPGNKALVHHIIAFIREPGNPWMRDAQARRALRSQEEASAGRRLRRYLWLATPRACPAQVLQPGQAKLVKAGSDIVLQMHYTANGKAGTDRSRIGIDLRQGTAQGTGPHPRGRQQ